MMRRVGNQLPVLALCYFSLSLALEICVPEVESLYMPVQNGIRRIGAQEKVHYKKWLPCHHSEFPDMKSIHNTPGGASRKFWRSQPQPYPNLHCTVGCFRGVFDDLIKMRAVDDNTAMADYSNQIIKVLENEFGVMANKIVVCSSLTLPF